MTPLLNPRTHRQLLGLGSGDGSLGMVLAGPEGIGKALSARWVARLRACAGEGGDGCVACRQIDAGTYPDLHVVTSGDKSSIGVEAVRELAEKLVALPYAKHGGRTVIIEDAHRLTGAAQSALLKMLEEPPERTMFLLVTDLPEVLLATVRSRLGRIMFERPAPGDIEAWLVARHGATATQAHEATVASNGLPGTALGRLREADATDIASGLVEGPLFDRLVAAAKLASSKADGSVVAAAVHARAMGQVRSEEVDATEAAVQVEAAARLRDDLSSNMTLRTALERFVVATS